MDSMSLSDLLAGAKKNEEEVINKDAAAQKLRDDARNGDAFAQNEVGDAFFRKKKYAKAFEWYAKAANQGYDAAIYNLAWCYHHGMGVDIDFKEAIKLYKKYIEKYGDEECMYQIGRCYEFGLNDIKEAKKWYQKAAEKQEHRSLEALEQIEEVYNDDSDLDALFKKGENTFWEITKTKSTLPDGTIVNHTFYGAHHDSTLHNEGMRWWHKAAELGHAKSQIYLALHVYQRRFHWDALALRWFTKAAENGHLPAMAALATKYEFGEGVEKDPRKSMEWYRKAAKEGDKIAINKIKELGEKIEVRDDNRPWKFKSGFRQFSGTLLMLFTVLAIVLVRRMDQMSFRSITEEEAMEMAQEYKVSLPDQEVTLLESGETQKLKTGKTVKVLGVYKEKLNKGNSPRVYWTSQKYLMELPDGTRAYGPLMETAIGQLTVLPEGDTAMITAVKKAKKNPTVQATGAESRFDYAYTLEGHKEQYALEDLHIYFPQRVAYLAKGLREEDYTAGRDTLAENKKDFQKVKKFFLYDIRPVTKKVGFFVFPKYQVWNEFYLKRWFRNLMIFVAYIVELLVIFRWIPRLFRKSKDNRRQRQLKRTYAKALKGDADACYRIGKAIASGELGNDFDIRGESVKWYERAADRGSCEACCALGKYYELKEDYIEAHRWYHNAAETDGRYKDDEQRVFNLYIAGNSVNKGVKAEREGDIATAVQLYRQAANAGHKIGEFNLGLCYLNGEGVRVDYQEAVRLFRSSAMKGYSAAQYMLGYCYGKGYGVMQNDAEAIRWYKKAAKNGDSEAIDLLNKHGISY